MFHSKDMGEIWHMGIKDESTCGFPSEEHTNRINIQKAQKCYFWPNNEASFSLIIDEVNVKIFENGVKLVP